MEYTIPSVASVVEVSSNTGDNECGGEGDDDLDDEYVQAFQNLRQYLEHDNEETNDLLKFS